ncbi:hypothetical protein CI109_101816 [Kwoniella shandongensis]|uniref:Uncharacterized protein n=1 Tax=Kwoniella shandongensis TaxID=1734106 RepID=A0A5M6C909_9TREE|nr:uncharacterized protein CI109_001062 [Kwoniella shandongensis]KAA5530262.1 hypothetical protein CI109_001062 [Kwoniella shandongensis]
MYGLGSLVAAASLLFLLPASMAAPAPDTIFLLKQSTFAPLGCSHSFHPTSILRQVPSPAACFSRCSTREIAAYSQLQSGVLCACGTEDMLEGIGSMTRCRDNTWFLFQNQELENQDQQDEEQVLLLVEEEKEEKKNTRTPWSLGLMSKQAAKKISWFAAKDEESSKGRVI